MTLFYRNEITKQTQWEKPTENLPDAITDNNMISRFEIKSNNLENDTDQKKKLITFDHGMFVVSLILLLFDYYTDLAVVFLWKSFEDGGLNNICKTSLWPPDCEYLVFDEAAWSMDEYMAMKLPRWEYFGYFVNGLLLSSTIGFISGFLLKIYEFYQLKNIYFRCKTKDEADVIQYKKFRAFLGATWISLTFEDICSLWLIVMVYHLYITPIGAEENSYLTLDISVISATISFLFGFLNMSRKCVTKRRFIGKGNWDILFIAFCSVCWSALLLIGCILVIFSWMVILPHIDTSDQTLYSNTLEEDGYVVSGGAVCSQNTTNNPYDIQVDWMTVYHDYRNYTTNKLQDEIFHPLIDIPDDVGMNIFNISNQTKYIDGHYDDTYYLYCLVHYFEGNDGALECELRVINNVMMYTLTNWTWNYPICGMQLIPYNFTNGTINIQVQHWLCWDYCYKS
eukprot:177825_1